METICSFFVSSRPLVAVEQGDERAAISLPQHFWQQAYLTAGLQIPQRKALTHEGRGHAFTRDPGPFPQTSKQERDPTLGKRMPLLREKKRLLAALCRLPSVPASR